MPLGRHSLATMQRGIDLRVRFTLTNLFGRESNGRLYFGRLTNPWSNRLHKEHSAGRIPYIVYSYDTPIAWRTTNGVWHIPDVTYDALIRQHQTVVAQAIADPGHYTRELMSNPAPDWLTTLQAENPPRFPEITVYVSDLEPGNDAAYVITYRVFAGLYNATQRFNADQYRTAAWDIEDSYNGTNEEDVFNRAIRHAAQYVTLI